MVAEHVTTEDTDKLTYQLDQKTVEELNATETKAPEYSSTSISGMTDHVEMPTKTSRERPSANTVGMEMPTKTSRDVDDAQWSRSRTYPIIRSPKRQGKLFTPLQWNAARIVEQVVNAVQSAVNPVCKFTQTKNPSSDIGEREIDNPD